MRAPMDAYQLKMYCDGYIKDHTIPEEKFIQLHLVAEKHSDGTKECIEFLRMIQDQRGRDISLNVQWFPEEP